jgi:dihydroorotase
LYAEIFEDLDALDKLEGFASHFGPDFYDLPRNTDTITLNKQDWTVPSEMPFAGDVIVPIKAGEIIRWAVEK